MQSDEDMSVSRASAEQEPHQTTANANMGAQNRYPQNCPNCLLQRPAPNQAPVNPPQPQAPTALPQRRVRGRPRRVDFMALRAARARLRPCLQYLLDYLDLRAPAKSVSPGIRYLCCATYVAAYADYLAWCRAQNIPAADILSFRLFRIQLRLWSIRRFRHDRYACPHCERVRLDPTVDNSAEYIGHRETVDSMSQLYQQHVAGLIDGESLVILLDYARFHEVSTPSVLVPERKKDGGHRKGNVKTSILGISILSKAESNEKAPTIHHLDILGPVKQGPAFMKYGIDILRQYLINHHPNFTNIHLWADGGLRSYGTLEVFSLLCGSDTKWKIDANYYAPYHGHNACDAHFGTGKLKLRRLGIDGMVDPKHLEDIFKAIPRTCVHLIPSTTASAPSKTSDLPSSLKHYQSFAIERTGDCIRLEAWKCRISSQAPDITHTIQVYPSSVTRPVDPDTSIAATAPPRMIQDEEASDDDSDNEPELYDSGSEEEDEEDEYEILKAISQAPIVVRADGREYLALEPPSSTRKRRNVSSGDVMSDAYDLPSKTRIQEFLCLYVPDRQKVERICDSRWPKDITWDRDGWINHAVGILDDGGHPQNRVESLVSS